jgi:pyruvate formate lyase activating enzyme
VIPRGMGSIHRRPGDDGLIFDIQKYSIQDGPGVRTLVFFKGCPLRCAWCSNPEGQNGFPELMRVDQKCIHCGKCLQRCKNGALSVTPEGQLAIDRDRCKRCGSCAETCYAEAMKMTGRYVTVEEIMPFLERDRAYYEESGGGITLGGGDPLAQPEFAERLLRSCKEHGLDTAMETSACFPWETVRKVKDYVDLFLIDLKMMDDERHREFTGVSNEHVLDNLRRLTDEGHGVRIRMPVVPGYNDGEDNMRATFAFAKGLKGSPGVELLPYFNLGLSKYQQLGRTYPTEHVVPPTRERMDELRALALEA